MTPSVRLLDIEGTVIPVSFVYETLFPYARRHLRGFLNQEHDAEFEAALSGLSKDRVQDSLAGEDAPNRDADYLLWLMDRDRKSTALKFVQGRIWQRGYECGDLHSQVFPDVTPAFERWTAAGQCLLCVLCSGIRRLAT